MVSWSPDLVGSRIEGSLELRSPCDPSSSCAMGNPGVFDGGGQRGQGLGHYVKVTL
jgi:hypothetical protein